MTEQPAIPPFLDRRPIVWTYTMLNTYRGICAHQAFRRYILKKGDDGHIPYSETPQMRRGNDVHSALELRVQGAKPLPPDMHDYESFARVFDGKDALCEPKLAVTREGRPCDYFAKDVWGRGRADVVIINGDAAYLADWKTGKLREDPFELEVQAVLLHAKYPHLRTIKGSYIWLADKTMGQVYDLSGTTTTWQTINHLMGLIENDRKRGEFDKEPGPLCGWCDVMDCEYNKKKNQGLAY